MNSILRCIAAAFLITSPAIAQIQLRPTPRPIVVADFEPWYVEGRPITHAGNIYYPVGPQIHFNGNEMVRSGFFQGVPLYSRTTLEPYSLVFVPLTGGLMHPYERRRAGDVAGTVGSTAPSFPVVLPAEEANRDEFGVTLQAPGPPTRRSTGVEPSFLDLATLTAARATEPSPIEPIGMAGAGNVPPLAVPARTRVESVQRPIGINGVFITFDNTRYFGGDPAVRFDPAQFVRTGDYKGFPVYRREGDERAIYIPVLTGEPGLLSVYRAR